MKRTAIRVGQKSIDRGSTFAADSKPLKRSRLRPAEKTRPRMRPEVGEEMRVWARRQICAACMDLDCWPVLGHHVLNQEWLISVARTLGIDPVPLLEDRRGWLAVGDRCHQLHHLAARRILRSVLRRYCPAVFEFAAELNLTRRLEETYPEGERA